MPYKDYWEKYWSDPSHYDSSPNSKILEIIFSLFPVKGKKILEIGAGRGVDSIVLAKNGADVSVLDYSDSAVEIIKKRAAEEKADLKIYKADANKLPFEDGTFDLIFHQGFIEHFNDPGPLIEEQKRVLKSGGYLMVDVPQKYNYYTLVKHFKMFLGKWHYGWETEYTIDGLRRFLQKKDFETVKEYGYGYYPDFLKKIRYLEERIKRRPMKVLFPEFFWKIYNFSWNRYEKTRLALYFFLCIGVVGKKK